MTEVAEIRETGNCQDKCGGLSTAAAKSAASGRDHEFFDAGKRAGNGKSNCNYNYIGKRQTATGNYNYNCNCNCNGNCSCNGKNNEASSLEWGSSRRVQEPMNRA
jgi:hypothetical protein